MLYYLSLCMNYSLESNYFNNYLETFENNEDRKANKY